MSAIYVNNQCQQTSSGRAETLPCPPSHRLSSTPSKAPSSRGRQGNWQNKYEEKSFEGDLVLYFGIGVFSKLRGSWRKERVAKDVKTSQTLTLPWQRWRWPLTALSPSNPKTGQAQTPGHWAVRRLSLSLYRSLFLSLSLSFKNTQSAFWPGPACRQ